MIDIDLGMGYVARTEPVASCRGATDTKPFGDNSPILQKGLVEERGRRSNTINQ